jgi:histone H3/H4
MKTSINTATCKKFLTETGMRASKEGILEFQKIQNNSCANLAEKAAEIAKSKKMKTIMQEHITEPL